MAGKKSTMILIDVSSSMGEIDSTSPTKQTRLESAKQVVLDYLHQKLKEGKKTAKFAIALLGADDCDDDKEESQFGLKLLYDFDVAGLQSMRDVDKLEPSTQSNVDISAALTFAADKLDKHVQHYKISKHVLLVTSADCAGACASISQAINDCNNNAVNLELIGVDVINAKNGSLEWKALENAVEGGTEIVANCKVLDNKVRQEYKFQSKSVGAIKKSLVLSIGSQAEVHVDVYSKVAEEKPPSLSKISLPAIQSAGGDPNATVGKVSVDRVYRSKSNPDVELGAEERTNGYTYGRTIVPFASTDEVAMKYVSEKGIQVLGSVLQTQIPVEMRIGTTKYMIANVNAPNSVEAFAALVVAMHKKQRALLLRYVDRDMSNPKLMCAFPSCDESQGTHSMYLTQLPLDEDVRNFEFKSVDDPAVTPSASQMSTARNLVAAMSLDENRFNPDTTYNPSLSYLFYCVRDRALASNLAESSEPDITRPLPPLPEDYKEIVSNSAEELKSAADAIKAFEKEFPLKQVAAKTKTKEFWGSLTEKVKVEDKTTKSSLLQSVKSEPDDSTPAGVDSWFKSNGASLVDSVQSVDPVGSFNAMLKRKDKDMSNEAVEGMITQIKEFVGQNGGSMYFPKALDCLITLREGCLKCSMEPEFNDFLTDLKEALLADDSTEFWEMIVKEGITLISNTECNTVSTTATEATVFLTVAPSTATVSTAPDTKAQDDDDLFDDME